MDPSHIQRYLQDPDGPLVLGQTQNRYDYSKEKGKSSTCFKKPSAIARAESSGWSSTSEKSAGVFSRKSSISSRATTVISGPPPSTLTGYMLNHDNMSLYDSELPCLLWYTTGCTEPFPGDDVRSWIAHSISHFGSRGPPNHSLCIFCDEVFESDTNALDAWTERMYHIAEHFERGHRLDRSRPDFHVITALYERGYMSMEDYDHAIEGSERPRVEGLKPLGYVPKERQERIDEEDRRVNEVRLDSRREERHRRSQHGHHGKSSRSVRTSHGRSER